PTAERMTFAASPARPSAEVAFGLQVTDHGLDGGSASQLALDYSEDAVFDDIAEGVAVVGIVRQRPDMQHELAAGGGPIVGDDGGFDAELVRRGGLALADAFDLWSVEGIELPAALALLLRADLRGAAKRECERLLKDRPTFDLAADVADDPAQPAAQDAQLPLMPLELFGIGVAARHHRRGL